MRISVIIPSYNQAAYLEACLLSLIEQSFPEKELIVIDGGSDDGSVEVIRKHESSLAYWVSESDKGQTHAINKGLEQATGEVWAYMNSDDLCAPDALSHIAALFSDSRTRWVAGKVEVFGKEKANGAIIPEPPEHVSELLCPWRWQGHYRLPCSAGVYMHREVLEKVGLFDESLEYCMDHEYYLRAIFKGGYEQVFTDRCLGKWRHHEASKTILAGSRFGFRKEGASIALDYLNFLPKESAKRVEVEAREQLALANISEQLYLSARNECSAFLPLLRLPVHHPRVLTKRYWYGAIKSQLFS